jgi:hypothetical protein
MTQTLDAHMKKKLCQSALHNFKEFILTYGSEVSAHGWLAPVLLGLL